MYKLGLEITQNCNLQCEYCYQSHFNNEMNLELAIEAINFGLTKAKSINSNAILISYFGGEPLLRFKNIELLTEYAKAEAVAHDMQVFFEITTNGTLLTREKCHFLVENRFSLKVSLDGLPEYHDQNRVSKNGKSTHAAVMKNMDLFLFYQKELKRPVQISMVISRNSYEGLLLNIKYLLGLGFKFFDVAINYTDKWTTDELKNLENEFEKVINFYFESAKTGRGFAWTFVDNGMKPQIKTKKHYFCGAGITNTFVNTEGDLYPCTACVKDEARIGTLREGISISKIDRFKQYKRKLSEECTNCSIQSYCSACDCLLMNLEMTGNYYSVPTLFCEFAKMRFKLTNKLLQNPEWGEIFQNYYAAR